MVEFEIFLAPIRMAINFLSSLSVAGIPLASYVVAFVLIGILFAFLRGGSND